MKPHTSIYLVERADDSGEYRRVSRSQIPASCIFEGVDGDEEANTVTYWYRRPTEDDES